MMYFNYNKVYSYQRFFNLLFGGRGIGKTYCRKKDCIKNFIKKGEQFIWIRRYDSENKIAKNGFFSKHLSSFPDHKFSIKGNIGYIDEKPACCFLALSKADNFKSFDLFDNVTSINYDEAIIDENSKHYYLKNELKAVLDVHETFCRNSNKCKIYIIANNVTLENPFTSGLNVDFSNSNVFVNKFVYAELLESSEEFKTVKNQTIAMQFAMENLPDYYNYNVNNKSAIDDYTNIEKIKGFKRLLFSLKIDNKIINVYEVYGSMVYFTFKGEKSDKIYTFDLMCVDENTLYCNKRESWFKYSFEKIKRGEALFDSLECKSLLRKNIF